MSEKFTVSKKYEETLPQNEALDRQIEEHLDLRFRFAEAVVKAKHLPLSEAILKYTDLYRHLGFEQTPKSENPIWQEYVAGVERAGSDHTALVAWTKEFHRSHREDLEDGPDPYYPFSYQYIDRTGDVYIHFGDMNIAKAPREGPGILSAEMVDVRKDTLRKMFQTIKALHPNAKKVIGESWLYNYESYRRLYPPEYTASPQEETGRVNGGSNWGQFYDARGGVNKERAAEFLRNMEHLDPEHVEAAFPLKRLVVGCDIKYFYDFYGIK